MSSNLIDLKSRNSNKQKPLQRFQEYLVESKATVILVRELLVELKELIVIVSLILFFIWAIIELFHKMNGS